MSVTCADVLAGFRTRWEATTEVTTAVPGGLHEGLALGALTAGPYAVVECSLKEHTRFSMGRSIQTFTLTVRVYAGASAEDAGAALAPVLAAFDDAAGWSVSAEGATVRVMDTRPLTQTLAADPKRKDGERVLVAARGWDVTLQVNPV